MYNLILRFSQTEQYYFHKWWLLQEDEVKDKVKSLINSGRLEIVNGGWCSNDEGITHYQSIIDQLTLGHRYSFYSSKTNEILNTSTDFLKKKLVSVPGPEWAGK